MNKKLIGIALILITAGVFAMGAFAAGGQEQVAVEGTLTMNEGYPAVESAGKTWLLPPGPFYQIAWENGIKVGDRIKAEGFSREGPFRAGDGAQDKAGEASMTGFLMPTRVWLNGKALDLSTLRRGFRGNGSRCGGPWGSDDPDESRRGRRGMGRGMGRGDWNDNR